MQAGSITSPHRPFRMGKLNVRMPLIVEKPAFILSAVDPRYGYELYPEYSHLSH